MPAFGPALPQSFLCDPECLLNGSRRTIDDEQVGAGGPFRFALPLLPMSKRVDAESESGSEGLLCQAQFRPNGFDIDVLRYVNAIRLLRTATLRVRDGLLQPLPNALCGLAHRRRPPYVSTSSFVSARKLFCSARDTFACSFFANAVNKNRG